MVTTIKFLRLDEAIVLMASVKAKVELQYLGVTSSPSIEIIEYGTSEDYESVMRLVAELSGKGVAFIITSEK